MGVGLLYYMSVITIFVIGVGVMAAYYLMKDSKGSEDVNVKKNRPSNVLIPDNVKKESQSFSTQREDAKRYDVNYEKKSLMSKGYQKVGESTYQKIEKNNELLKDDTNNYDNYIEETKKEFDPVNNKNDQVRPLNDDEDDDNPIKDI